MVVRWHKGCGVGYEVQERDDNGGRDGQGSLRQGRTVSEARVLSRWQIGLQMFCKHIRSSIPVDSDMCSGIAADDAIATFYLNTHQQRDISAVGWLRSSPDKFFPDRKLLL